ncbi:hypothetical protein [Thermosulfurimonas sp. F29]|uniref:hypothetical protein n=1 Tax=Thermosulfurimonas sp. F29 TaxID=2867247 RepID=UPI001C838C09|nr:hypothetical protein [Thermosulfurimonas sp. F29]MBX6424018.1 hypothetical protein [Thermosulfurimonas sp. F29]
MKNFREYLFGGILLLFFSIRYYPGYPQRTLLATGKFLVAVILYGLGVAFLCKWAIRQFFKKELVWENFFKIALWAAVIMSFGESLRHYFYPY